jgi:hypothetical protein
LLSPSTFFKGSVEVDIFALRYLIVCIVELRGGLLFTLHTELMSMT